MQLQYYYNNKFASKRLEIIKKTMQVGYKIGFCIINSKGLESKIVTLHDNLTQFLKYVSVI